ncbi:MAG: beta-propeller fold lactonase family protein [Acidobacteriaceae bacterium]|nr:beta-propeller fold lactonase family protein [Acidobacteriaceae bacterium]
MKLSLSGRFALALFATLTLGLGMTGCGGGTVAFLWVLGQQYNQVASFKVDDYTGNLTQTPHQPFTSGGSTPVAIQVKTGGRYVYVLNQGTLPADCTADTVACQEHWTNGNVSVFSVGGDGVLTFQQSYVTQGFKGKWMAFDSTGNYLYVLDQYSPSGDGNGSVTAYSVDSSSGRLYLVQNTQSVANGAAASTYFEVGSSSLQIPTPFKMMSTGSCLFINNNNTILPYTFSSGQLVVATNGAVQLSSANISSIGGNSTLMSITDSTANTVALYSISSTCSLTAINGGTFSMAALGTANPQYSIIDSSGKYLYVLNQSTTSTLPTITYSSIMGFTINQTNSQLQAIAGAPWSVGSNPTCLVEDPTNQYLYTSDHDTGTVTGKVIDTTTGIISALTRGSTFTATGQAQCLAISGSVD